MYLQQWRNLKSNAPHYLPLLLQIKIVIAHMFYMHIIYIFIIAYDYYYTLHLIRSSFSVISCKRVILLLSALELFSGIN